MTDLTDTTDTAYSLSELEAHAKKAVRGAGFAWGYAEEAAKAVRLLAAHQLPGAVVLAAYLSERADGGVGEALCPLLSGAGLCDGVDVGRETPSVSPKYRLQNKTVEAKGSALQHEQSETGDEVVLAELAYPLLVLPYVVLLSRRLDCALQVTWEGVELACHQGRLLRVSGGEDALLVARAVRFTCLPIAVADVGEEAGMRGQVVSAAVWRRLDNFAQHTYVPATEESRRGAGPA